MFGIGIGELLVIGALLLIAVGPHRMPTMMKSVGRALREFRKATRELRAQVGLDEMMAEDDVLRPMKKVPPRARPEPAATRTPPAEMQPAAAAREYPPEGVDVAESSAATKPPKVEA